MTDLTISQIKDFAIVLAALLGAIVLIGNVIKTVKNWKEPHDDMQEWRRGVDNKLKADKDRLDCLEQGNKVICRGILALLSHEVNGNSIDKLTKSQAELTDYLIDR